MSDTRTELKTKSSKKADAPLHDSLIILRHEIANLHLAIQEANVKELQEIINLRNTALANNDPVLQNDIATKSKQAELDHEARLQIYTDCKRMANHLQFMLKPNRRLFTFNKHLPTIAKVTFLEDIRLMTETVKLTNQLISQPENAISTLQSLEHHSNAVVTHLNNEKADTKKKRIWGGILIGLAILVVPVSMVIAGLSIAALSGGGLISLVYAYAAALLCCAICVPLFLAGLHLTGAADHAQKQVDLCNNVRTLHKTKP